MTCCKCEDVHCILKLPGFWLKYISNLPRPGGFLLAAILFSTFDLFPCWNSFRKATRRTKIDLVSQRIITDDSSQQFGKLIAFASTHCGRVLKCLNYFKFNGRPSCFNMYEKNSCTQYILFTFRFPKCYQSSKLVGK